MYGTCITDIVKPLNGVIFNFVRYSDRNTYPLISSLYSPRTLPGPHHLLARCHRQICVPGAIVVGFATTMRVTWPVAKTKSRQLATKYPMIQMVSVSASFPRTGETMAPGADLKVLWNALANLRANSSN